MLYVGQHAFYTDSKETNTQCVSDDTDSKRGLRHMTLTQNLMSDDNHSKWTSESTISSWMTWIHDECDGELHGYPMELCQQTPI